MNRVGIGTLVRGDKVNSDGGQGEEESKNWWGEGFQGAP